MFSFMIHTPTGWQPLIELPDRRKACEFADRWAAANPPQRIRVAPVTAVI